MPIFYFHLRDDLDTPDTEGSELPDLQAARQRAAQDAVSLMCETLSQEGRITLHHQIDIEDEQHRLVETLRFADVVTVED